VDALRAHPATGRAWEVAREWAEDAKAVLEPLPEGTVKLALAAFAEGVVDRDV